MKPNCKLCKSPLKRSDAVFCLTHRHGRKVDKTKKCTICNKALFTNNQLNLCRVHRRALPVGKEREKGYRLKNLKHHQQVAKEYAATHKKQKAKRILLRHKDRIKTDVQYRLICNLRRSLKRAIQKSKTKKLRSSRDILGADMNLVRLHLEKQFSTGMTWNNYGYRGWHIDHIIPLSSAKTIEDIMRLCHYTNIQPLWAFENMSKGAKFPFGHLGDYKKINSSVDSDVEIWREKLK